MKGRRVPKPTLQVAVESDDDKMNRMVAEAVSAALLTERELHASVLAQKNKELEDLQTKNKKRAAIPPMDRLERMEFIERLCTTVRDDQNGHCMWSLTVAPQYKNIPSNSRFNCTDCTIKKKRDRSEWDTNDKAKKIPITAQYCVQCSLLNYPELYIVCTRCLQGHPHREAL